MVNYKVKQILQAHLALISVQAHVIGGEANLSAGIPHDLLVVHLRAGSDLSKDHDHVGLSGSLTGHLAHTSGERHLLEPSSH